MIFLFKAAACSFDSLPPFNSLVLASYSNHASDLLLASEKSNASVTDVRKDFFGTSWTARFPFFPLLVLAFPFFVPRNAWVRTTLVDIVFVCHSSVRGSHPPLHHTSPRGPILHHKSGCGGTNRGRSPWQGEPRDGRGGESRWSSGIGRHEKTALTNMNVRIPTSRLCASDRSTIASAQRVPFVVLNANERFEIRTSKSVSVSNVW